MNVGIGSRPVTATANEFGAFLVTRGVLDRTALERAIRWQDERNAGLIQVLTSLGLIPERELAALLSEFLSIPQIHAGELPEDLPVEGRLSSAFLRQAGALPVAETSDRVILAVVDPFDTFVRQSLAAKLGKPVELRIAVRSEIEAAIDRLFAEGRSRLSEIVEGLDKETPEDADDEERLRDLASEAPVIRLVNLLVRRAVEMRASDVHVEPYPNRLRVRYRIDGVLRDVEAPPAALRSAVLSRIKIMARLNIAERRLPQDGRIKLIVQGKEIDLRVSIIPTMHGESAVLRILDGSEGVYRLEELGFTAEQTGALRQLLRRPNGVVLVTGPTGSGKTTTLYASLLELNRPDRKIVTVEDPVEYQLEGINQIQVKPQIGLKFADVLRSILRHDPDIIMIGEIRDLETAQIAVQASLTGHLVLSTLHTNTAAASVTRLLDMGVENYLLTSTVAGVVAQRLVRRLCEHCREPQVATPELLHQLGLGNLGGRTTTLYRPIGCDQCDGSGYLGRSCVAEILVMDETMQTLVLRNASARELTKAAADAGMVTMYQDGMAKALAGITSADEVLRVTTDTGAGL